MKAPTPLHDTDFSLMTQGKVKDGGREPYFGYTSGDKYPCIIGTWLTKENKQFRQAFMSFPAFFAHLSDIEQVALFPGEGKVAKTTTIMRRAQGGKEVPSGTTIVVSRRADGLISIRFENNTIREAIFPLTRPAGVATEMRQESGEPIDPRHDYRQAALDFVAMQRAAGYAWKAEITSRGNAQRKEEFATSQGRSSSWG